MKKKLHKNKKEKDKKKRPKFDIHSDALKSLWGVMLIVLFFLSILSLFGKGGAAGDLLAEVSKFIFGWGMFVIPLLLLIGAYVLFNSWRRNTYLPLIIGGVLFVSGMLGILGIFSQEEIMRGGYWGYIISLPFIKFFGNLASLIIFLGFIMVSAIVAFNIKIGRIIENKKERLKALRQNVEPLVHTSSDHDPAQSPKFTVKTWKDEDEKFEARNSKFETNPKPQIQNSKQNEEENKKTDDFEPKFVVASPVGFRLPPVELLEKETGRPSSGDIIANANIMKRTFQNFGIEVEMGEVNVGPTVTQFTLKPAEGVKLSRVMSLNNDLSLALASHPIRIEAPIPGRSLVGIEMPNKGFTIVRLKNLIEGKDFQNRSSTLTLCFGRDVAGVGVYANLAKMPHLLIAGSTGSGKTICLNVVIMSLLYQNPPNLLKFILIDPKRVEFPIYADIPHLLAPIVVETQKAVGALKWAVAEMEQRFDILSRARARDIEAFNSNKKIVRDFGPLPYIVIIIDELADLMSSRGKEIEALVVRLAQMSRAVGIHLVLATQRPSVEVITGLIKANITSRIAFQVASQIDSRTVLDMAGAEKLLGNGDMLYLAGDASKPRRVQGAYITEKEVRRVTDYLREEGEKLKGEGDDVFEKDKLLRFNLKSSTEVKPQFSAQFDFDEIESDSDDELYGEAKKTVIQSQKASASLLQRRLRVGYARAARLIDMLEEGGVVGPPDGAKAREVYIERDESNEL